MTMSQLIKSKHSSNINVKKNDMDENIWRFAQIVVWLIGLQTVVLGGIFAFLWNNLSKRIDDLGTKLDKNTGEINAKIDRNEAKFNAKLDTKSDPLEKDLIQINTKLAVMESRLSDISTNVTHLLWHQQVVPPKEDVKGS